MTYVIALLLLAMWAAVLLPPVLRNRSQGRPGDSIHAFNHQMRVMERSKPTGSAFTVPTPVGRDRVTPRVFEPVSLSPQAQARRAARRRRRDVLLILVSAVGLSLVAALSMGGIMWFAHLLIDVLLGAYVALLLRSQRIAAEREMKVRFLPHTNPDAAPTKLLESVN